MAKSRRQLVRDRAKRRCEYCRMPQDCDVQPFQVDHIRAQKHAGANAVSNLAWSCLPWNSEVGRRSIGIPTFWFQAICQNHIVWDAVEVAEFTRKHTTNVGESLLEIRRHIETLVSMRDSRRDAFAKTIGNAMQQVLGEDTKKVVEKLREIPKFDLRESLLTEALASARQHGRLTVFSIVDALTKLSQRVRYAGDRLELDRQAARLLMLAG